MFCDRCGVNLQGEPAFCPMCGKAFRTAGIPLRTPPLSRIAGHLRTLSILWIVISAFRLLPRLFLYTLWRDGDWFFDRGIPFMGHWIGAFVGLSVAFGVLGIIAGWGLHERQPWARMLAIVVGCFSLLQIPFGTVLGIYTLWVLLPAESEMEYRRISGSV